MKTPSTVFSLCILLCLSLAAALPAVAQQTLYEDGPINGETDAWTINFGFIVSNTFTISGGTSTITGMSFGAWLFPGDIVESVEVLMTSSEFGGTTYFDQVVPLTASSCFQNNFGFDVCQENSTFQGPTLNNGTYWMNLENAVVSTGDPVYWDENSGIGCHSQGCPSEPSQNSVGTIPPESFTILGTQATGTTGTTPEPAGLILFGTGVAGMIGVLRRKLL
jgi:hypothetical protein